MKDHRMPFLGIGAASIVLVLTIVSLSVFATLTISSANGDYTLSQKNLERTTNYYKASNEVNCTLSQIDKKLWKNYHKTKNKKSFFLTPTYLCNILNLLSSSFLSYIFVYWAA